MKRTARPVALGLALGVLLFGGALVVRADPPAPPGADAVQVVQPQTPPRDTSADQLAGPAPKDATAAPQLQTPGAHPTAPAQITMPGGHGAPAQLTHPAVGRNTQVGAVAGRDRCDPASAEAKAPECASIPENRPGDFQTDQQTDATPDTVDPNAPSQDLVNGILSSGTGTVVQLPPK